MILQFIAIAWEEVGKAGRAESETVIGGMSKRAKILINISFTYIEISRRVTKEGVQL